MNNQSLFVANDGVFFFMFSSLYKSLDFHFNQKYSCVDITDPLSINTIPLCKDAFLCPLLVYNSACVYQMASHNHSHKSRHALHTFHRQVRSSLGVYQAHLSPSCPTVNGGI